MCALLPLVFLYNEELNYHINWVFSTSSVKLIEFIMQIGNSVRATVNECDNPLAIIILQILSFILQINGWVIRLGPFKLICSIFQMFARNCAINVYCQWWYMGFCLEITIILITMALRRVCVCSNYFYIFFHFFFSKKKPPRKWQSMSELRAFICPHR